MHIRKATATDAATIVLLEKAHFEDELSEQRRGGMMVGQTFTLAQIQTLISQHWVIVAKVKGDIIAYVIAGGWPFFKQWPIYDAITTHFHRYQLNGVRLNQHNCCQYGPIWIDKAHRGQGLIETMVDTLKRSLASQYCYMLTFIDETNERSLRAHTGKTSFQIIDFLSFNENDYYLLATKSLD